VKFENKETVKSAKIYILIDNSFLCSNILIDNSFLCFSKRKKRLIIIDAII